MTLVTKASMRGLSRSPIDQSIENLRNAQRTALLLGPPGRSIEAEIRTALVVGIASGLEAYRTNLAALVVLAEAVPPGRSGLVPDPVIIVRAELKNALRYARIA